MTERSIPFDKSSFRRRAKTALAENAPFQEEKSERVRLRLETLPEFTEALAAGGLMAYLDFDHEVRTTALLAPRLEGGGSIVVPFCGDDIIPYKIFSWDELDTGGPFGIREPIESVRNDPSRRATPESISLVLVPGLAFDRRGNRLGRGKGYYDRFLSGPASGVRSIALAFQCQIFPDLPVDANDRRVDVIVTDEEIIRPGDDSRFKT